MTWELNDDIFFLYKLIALELTCFLLKVAKERLNQVITDAGEKDLSDLCSEPLEIETVLNCNFFAHYIKLVKFFLILKKEWYVISKFIINKSVSTDKS